jgi:hypothetical protein
VTASEIDPTEPLLLETFDAVVILPSAWPPDAPDAAAQADAMASFTRRGGLLIGPAPGRAWPPPLGQRLGTAGGASLGGTDGMRSFGLGRVVRAGSEAEIRDVLAAGVWRRGIGTVFDLATTPPSRAAPLAPWCDDPARRRMQGLLLLVYAFVAAGLDRVLRSFPGRILGGAAPALAVVVGLWWTSPADPGVRTHALAFDLGGGGGRRVEAVALAAGPAGWWGRLAFEGGGTVRLLGGRIGRDGTVRIGPGRTAWALRETVSGGDRRGFEPDARAAFLTSYLRGEPEPRRLFVGRGPPLGVHGAGAGRLRPWTAFWR